MNCNSKGEHNGLFTGFSRYYYQTSLRDGLETGGDLLSLYAQLKHDEPNTLCAYGINARVSGRALRVLCILKAFHHSVTYANFC
ncbi:MAG: hypothetical protein Q8865_00365 [Bacillota bacterium]|nr:hypothetical protein [Bacillota bacterium]